MLMRWIGAAGVRPVARDQPAAGKLIPASGEIAAPTRFSCGDCRRGRRRATTVAPRRPRRGWPLGQAESDEIVRAEKAGVGGALISSYVGSRTRSGRLGRRPLRRGARRVGVAPCARGRSAA
jgi:hypothetical protein